MILWQEVLQNGQSLIDFQLRYYAQTGRPYATYLWGGDGQRADDDLVYRLYKTYPWHFDQVLKQKGKTLQQLMDHVRGTFVFDCSGLACVMSESPYDMASGSLWNNCIKKTNPVDGPKASLLWKEGHVGLDMGTGYVLEMVGEFDDLRLSRIRSRDFTKSGQLPWIDYTGAGNDKDTFDK